MHIGNEQRCTSVAGFLTQYMPNLNSALFEKPSVRYPYITSTAIQIDRHMQQSCIQPPCTHSLDLEYQEFAYFWNL